MDKDTSGTDKLLAASDEAASVLLDLMRSARSEYVRLYAAKAILEAGELTSQIKRLEKEMAENVERMRLFGNTIAEARALIKSDQ
jgi:hypothetical protein